MVSRKAETVEGADESGHRYPTADMIARANASPTERHERKLGSIADPVELKPDQRDWTAQRAEEHGVDVVNATDAANAVVARSHRG